MSWQDQIQEWGKELAKYDVERPKSRDKYELIMGQICWLYTEFYVLDHIVEYADGTCEVHHRWTNDQAKEAYDMLSEQLRKEKQRDFLAEKHHYDFFEEQRRIEIKENGDPLRSSYDYYDWLIDD